ncbi:MAG TPA: hypothetical protein V6D07_17430 [Trichocoleus sp.]
MSKTVHLFHPSKPEPSNSLDHLVRWCYRHQAQALHTEAETIRNGILQDLFALRRKLELSCPLVGGEGCVEAEEPCLGDIEQIYAALETLSDRLSSPYLQDSLPLAIQHALQPWQMAVGLALDLPSTWAAEPPEHIALILTLLRHSLSALATVSAHCQLSLHSQPQSRHLTLRATYDPQLPSPFLATVAATPSPSQGDDLPHLLQAFQAITGGETAWEHQPGETLWQLCW